MDAFLNFVFQLSCTLWGTVPGVLRFVNNVVFIGERDVHFYTEYLLHFRPERAWKIKTLIRHELVWKYKKSVLLLIFLQGLLPLDL